MNKIKQILISCIILCYVSCCGEGTLYTYITCKDPSGVVVVEGVGNAHGGLYPHENGITLYLTGKTIEITRRDVICVEEKKFKESK
jgi:hypothetical protein